MKYEDLNNTDLWKRLAKVIDMSIETYPANSFSNLSFKNFDPNLLQLIALIKRLIIRVPHTESDVHANNIMVRMGTTPQVVLSDPISSEDTLNPTQYQTT
jgi:siderophore synthetase component